MKQTGIAIMVLFLVVTACKKESDMHSFFRRTNDKNLKTLYDGEFYSFAAADSSLIRADYFLNVQGEITSYGDTIIAYGHCWSKTNTNPSIGHDHDTIIIGSSLPGITLTFPSYISGLESDTEYSIRSFAIFGDAQGNPIDTGYNPIVSQIATLPAIDEWFVKEGGDLKPQGARFDAISFNLGDTIFFGTGDQGNRNPTKDIWMYDPTKSKWEEIGYVNAIRLPVIGEYMDELTNGTGFALTFQDKNAAEGDYIRCIYIGLGDYDGRDLRDYKSQTFWEKDIDDGSWRETSVYTGGICSGAVSFVIGSKAYVGTGSGTYAKFDWHVFDPVADRDGNDLTFGWQTIDPPNEVARTGAIAFAIGGKGYFGLGKSADGEFLKDFWEFTPNEKGTNGTWIKKLDFPGAPRQNAAAFVIGTQGYVGTGDDIIGDMEGGGYTGQTYSDVYRYDPFNNSWRQIRDYTLDKTENPDNPKKVTRATGFSRGPKASVGYIGFGMMPEEVLQRAQEDLWEYLPWQTGAAIYK